MSIYPSSLTILNNITYIIEIFYGLCLIYRKNVFILLLFGEYILIIKKDSTDYDKTYNIRIFSNSFKVHSFNYGKLFFILFYNLYLYVFLLYFFLFTKQIHI